MAKNIEHSRQSAIFSRSRSLAKGIDVSGRMPVPCTPIPEFGFMYAIPNGGLRDMRTAISIKREGGESGVPDFHWPIARGGYISLYVEMKTDEGSLSPNQKIWIPFLRSQGHKVIIGRDVDTVWCQILEYWNSGPTRFSI